MPDQDGFEGKVNVASIAVLESRGRGLHAFFTQIIRNTDSAFYPVLASSRAVRP